MMNPSFSPDRFLKEIADDQSKHLSERVAAASALLQARALASIAAAIKDASRKRGS